MTRAGAWSTVLVVALVIAAAVWAETTFAADDDAYRCRHGISTACEARP